MLAWVLLSAVMVTAFGIVSSKITLDDWHCGSEDMSKQAAYKTAMTDCPLIAGELNHCCVLHDDCYVRQAGQYRCDREFCICNKKVMNQSQVAGRGCATEVDFLCSHMTILGLWAYISSDEYREPENMTKHIPDVSKTGAAYGELYQKCSQSNSTLSSCALLYNHCDRSKEGCGGNLCDCIRDVPIIHNQEGCSDLIEDVCRIIAAEHVSFLQNIISTWRVGGTNAMVFFMSLCLLFTVAIIFTAWRRSRNIEEKNCIKYQAVDLP